VSAPPYQKLFWGSYHKHTAHLSNAREHGAYLLLIGALWNNEGRLPSDDVTLAGHAKVTLKEWEAIRPKLINGTLLKIVRGKLTQSRVTEDLAKYRDTSGKRKEAGRAGGLASGGKTTGKRKAFASVLPTKPEPEPEGREERLLHSLSPTFRTDDAARHDGATTPALRVVEKEPLEVRQAAVATIGRGLPKIVHAPPAESPAEMAARVRKAMA
jgi:uncharacterized protein YdaU (DUF1376 family)